MVAKIIKSKYVVFKDDIKFVYSTKNRLTMRRSGMIVASLTIRKVESESLAHMISRVTGVVNPRLLEVSELRRELKSKSGDGTLIMQHLISELKPNQVLFAKVKPDSVDVLTPMEVFYRELVGIELYFGSLGFKAISNNVHQDNYLIMVYFGNL